MDDDLDKVKNNNHMVFLFIIESCLEHCVSDMKISHDTTYLFSLIAEWNGRLMGIVEFIQTAMWS